jgi:integrase/recombinase XerD
MTLRQQIVQDHIDKTYYATFVTSQLFYESFRKWNDLRYIQELLGHSSSKTTEIYTHTSTKSIQQIKSPFNDL